MRRILFIDFETRSEADLLAVGSHKYLMHPTTSVILMSYAFDNEPVVVCKEVPDEVRDAVEDYTVIKVAHNAEFDMGVCRYVEGMEINYNDWYDTAYAAAYYGYPRRLKSLAKELRITEKGSQEELLLFSKPKVCATVMERDDLFCIPSNTVWNEERDFPDEWEMFERYSAGDITVMREAFNKMVLVPDIERFTMSITYEMNFNGVNFDADFAKEVLHKAEEYTANASAEARRLYGIENLRSTPQVLKALLKEGIYMTTLNAKDREGTEHEILTLRDQASGAAFAKIPKALERMCMDQHLRGEFVGHGAHTGRWTSRGVQLQNLSRILSEVCTDLSKVRDYSHLREHMRLTIGNRRGYNFNCADLSQIEARIVAWLARCTWRMEAFKAGVDIYARSAERMFSKPHVDKGDPERHDAKQAELGFGYGGGKAAIARINAAFYASKGEAAIQALVDTWRFANPEICALWRKLESGFREAMKTGECRVTCNTVVFVINVAGNTARITLPSGRALYYRGVSVVQTDRGSELYYMDYSRGGEKPAVRTKFWGGTLLENVTQAIAKDVIVEIMHTIHKKYPHLILTGTVHDEIWYDSLIGGTSPEEREPLECMLKAMAARIPWAKGLITKGEGFTDVRYIK